MSTRIGDLYMALRHLQRARDLLKKAGEADKAVERVRTAIKSTEGYERRAFEKYWGSVGDQRPMLALEHFWDSAGRPMAVKSWPVLPPPEVIAALDSIRVIGVCDLDTHTDEDYLLAMREAGDGT